MNTSISSEQFAAGTLSSGILLALLVALEPPASDAEAATPAPEPIVVQATPTFSEFAAGPERKAAFFSYFTPIVERENRRVLDLRQELKSLQQQAHLQPNEVAFLTELARRHRVQPIDPTDDQFWESLMKKVDVVPVSLALAQAANESGWGTSRFARVANNYFGQWCFEQGCGVVPKQRPGNMNHEVRSFEHPSASVRAYIRNLNSHPAYRPLRSIRAELRLDEKPVSGAELAEGLRRYSERGEEYVEEIQLMIRQNRLYRMDSA